MTNPLEHSHDFQPPHEPRGAGTWLLLAIVWVIGFISWMVWLGIGGYLFYRIVL